MKISIIPDRKDSELFYPVQSRSGTSPLPPPGDSQEVFAMPLLVDAFVQGALIDENQKLSERKRKGELHFLASVFANITTVGFVDQTLPRLITDSYAVTNWPKLLFDAVSLETITTRLASGISIGEIDRVHGTQGQDQERWGWLHYQVSGQFVFQDDDRLSSSRNCAFNTPAHKAMLLPETERVAVTPSTKEAPGVDALPAILLPLAGPEEFDLDVGFERSWKVISADILKPIGP